MAKKYKKVKYEIDLIKVMERALSDRPRQVKDKLRALMADQLFKKKYGENIIDEIEKRTLKGIDKNDKPFKKPYSNMYQKSLEFKIYGKSPNKVNLKLTGEMLASMKIGNSKSRSVKILMADDFNNAKAHGHINGIKRKVFQGGKVKKGKKAATFKVKRDFLGLPPDDEDKILKDTIKIFNAESLESIIDFEQTTLDFGGTNNNGTEIVAAAVPAGDSDGN